MNSEDTHTFDSVSDTDRWSPGVLTEVRFRTAEVLAHSGVPKGLFQTWANRAQGVGEQNPGRGRSRMWSAIDIATTTLKWHVVAFGLDVTHALPLAAAVEEELKTHGGISWLAHVVIGFHQVTAERRWKIITTARGLGKFGALMGGAEDLVFGHATEFHMVGLGKYGYDRAVDPKMRAALARRGMHAEPALIIPVGEIVSATLIRLLMPDGQRIITPASR